MLDKDTMLVKEITRVFLFEHWARFYYAVEREGKVFLEVPADVMESCKQKYPELTPLLEESNGKEMTYEASCVNVGAFVCRALEGDKYKSGDVVKALDSKPFRVEQQMLALWLKGHEAYLDQHQLTFDDWMEMFHNWMQMEQVKTFADKLHQTPSAEGDKPQTVN